MFLVSLIIFHNNLNYRRVCYPENARILRRTQNEPNALFLSKKIIITINNTDYAWHLHFNRGSTTLHRYSNGAMMEVGYSRLTYDIFTSSDKNLLEGQSARIKLASPNVSKDARESSKNTTLTILHTGYVFMAVFFSTRCSGL